MNDVQILAYVIMPISVAALAWIVALAVNPPRWIRRIRLLRSEIRQPIVK